MSMVRTPWPGKKQHQETGEEENCADGIFHNMAEEPQDWMMIHRRSRDTDIKIVCRQPDQDEWNRDECTDKKDHRQRREPN